MEFNELDNWLGIMEVDPPKTDREKREMYLRLLDILEDFFAADMKGLRGPNDQRRSNKFKIRSEMRAIIDP